MSIIEEVKKNVILAANNAAKKTTEVSGIAKLNVNTKLEEAKLSECYENIGRLFYSAERNGEENTAEIASYIMEADKIRSTIAGYKKELAKLKGVTICEGCGAEISDNVCYCPVCGTKQVKKVEECTCECTETTETCECECEGKCECECEEKCDCECTESCECTCDETPATESECTECGCGVEETETPDEPKDAE